MAEAGAPGCSRGTGCCVPAQAACCTWIEFAGLNRS
jgi:hypothetical protein